MNFKKLTTFIMLLAMLGFSSIVSATPAKPTATTLEWKVQNQWQLPENPIDIVHSLDGKFVFVLTSKQNVLIYTAQGNLEGTVPVDKGVVAIDIAPRAEMLYLIDSEKKTFTTLSIDFVKDINTAGSPFKGPADAPVTIALFTDFECPYCSKITPLIDQVLEQNAKTVKVVFKNMPLQFHKFADPAARAALAAKEQGKFWEFHDELFSTEKLSDKSIEEIAVKLGLNVEKWKNDMNSPVVRQRVNVDLQDAQKAGVTGTPTIFVNGRLVKNRSIQGFQQMINEELSKKQ